MSFEKLKLCTRVLAPKRTYVTNIQTWKTTPTPEVLEWFDKNNIRDFELVEEGWEARTVSVLCCNSRATDVALILVADRHVRSLAKVNDMAPSNTGHTCRRLDRRAVEACNCQDWARGSQ